MLIERRAPLGHGTRGVVAHPRLRHLRPGKQQVRRAVWKTFGSSGISRPGTSRAPGRPSRWRRQKGHVSFRRGPSCQGFRVSHNVRRHGSPSLGPGLPRAVAGSQGACLALFSNRRHGTTPPAKFTSRYSRKKLCSQRPQPALCTDRGIRGQNPGIDSEAHAPVPSNSHLPLSSAGHSR